MAVKDKHPKTRPVIVRWIDSMASPGWRSYERSDMECTSVGHLVERTKDRVCICLNRSHCGDGDYMEIPTSAIKSVKRLKE